MRSFKEKMESLNARKDSKWEKQAKFLKENKWLDYSHEIAVRILAAIESDKELNQTRLAETLGVSRQQVSKILQGKENLTLETIYKISRALGTELITFPPHTDRYPLGKKKSRKGSAK